MAGNLSVSLSESVQASLIIQHQEERFSVKNPHRSAKSGRKLKSNSGLTKTHSETSVVPSLLVQCLMVMVFSGIEMCVNFMLIYSILFLQFLGVPTSLVTVGGIIGGGISIIFLPITGYFADRGPDLVIRKMKMTMISLSMYIVGFSGVAICAGLRFHANNVTTKVILDYDNNIMIENITGGSPTTPYVLNQTKNYQSISALSKDELSFISMHDPNLGNNAQHNNMATWNMTILYGNSNNYVEYSMGTIQIMGIVCLALLDAGFDTGMSVCRAFILEVSPPSIHNQLLIMATISSAVGGLAMSSIGTIDFPNILGPAFGIDGTAATVFMFSFGILAFIIFGFVCTLLSGYSIYRHKRREGSLCSDYTKSKRFETSEPLLSANSVDTLSYSSFGDVGQKKRYNYKHSNEFDKNQYQRILSPWEHNTTNIIHEGKLYDHPSSSLQDPEVNSNVENNTDDEESNLTHEDSHHFTNSLSENDTENDNNENSDIYNDNNSQSESHNLHCKPEEQSEISNIYAAMRTSYSMSISMFVSSSHAKTNTHSQKLATGSGSDLTHLQPPTKSNQRSIWSSKRLWCLLLSIFFTLGANLCFTTYSAPTLNLGVYHGDPLAPDGSTERDNYNKGLRSGALGTLVLDCAFCLICFLNKYIIDIIGEKPYFVVCQAANIIAFSAFTVTKMQELYFTLSCVAGIYRGCAFTLGYIMVNKLIKEKTDESDGQSSTHIGKVMAVIGFLLPSKYVILSIMVGPMMAALDSVWVPMVIGAVEGALALMTFCLFLVIKD